MKLSITGRISKMGKLKHTKKEWYPVRYANYIRIQDGPFYEDRDILDTEQIGEEEAVANAKLITAAPDLLEALIEARELIGNFRIKKEVQTQETWEKIERAIKKVTE